jgi:hypothetical protein
MNEESSGQDFVDNRKDIARNIESLPSLQEGYLRLLHGTDPQTAEQIAIHGLDYSEQGMIDATTRSYSLESGVDYYTDDPRFSWGKTVVIDMPADEYRLHRDVTKSPGKIPAEYIIGIIDAQKPETSK